MVNEYSTCLGENLETHSREIEVGDYSGGSNWMGMNNKCKCSQNSVVKNVGIRRLKRCQQTIANGSMNAESARHLWKKEGDCCIFCSYGTVKCPPKQSGECCS